MIEFTGLVTDPACPLPGEPEAGRTQEIRLDQGVSVLLYMETPARRGDRIRGKAVFACGEGSRNPGGFSERNWLWSKGAVWTGYARQVEISPRDNWTLALKRLPDRLRDWVRQRHASFWRTPPGPLLLSLTLGDTRLLEDKETYWLRASGLSHLTSVSGTHLIFLLGPAAWLARRTSSPRRLRQGLTLPLILLPGILSGWKTGISRASIMAMATRLDPLMRQRRDLFNLLFLTGSALLVSQPYSIYDQSFWMSLSTAGAVSYTATRLSCRDNSIRQKFKTTLCFSLTAQLILLPYQMMTSPGIHLLSPLVNVIALPLAACLMAVSYPAVLILSCLPTGTGVEKLATSLFLFLLKPVSWLILCLSEMVAKFNQAFVPLRLIFLLIPLPIAIFLVKRNRQSRRTLRLTCALLASLIWIAAVWLVLYRPDQSQVLFLDVGQGDASLFVSGSGRSLLIDGGDKGNGFSTIIPAARSLSLRRIDLAIVTHAHADHAAGIAELMEAGFIGQLFLPAVDAREAGEEDDMTDELLLMANQSGTAVNFLKQGDSFSLAGWMVEVLHPAPRESPVDLNEASLVMRVTMEGLSILMTGDLTEEGEGQLIRTGRDFSSQLLHVPHHGSRYSSSEAFLDACGAGTALISSGRNNRYGHPHPDVLDRLDQRGVSLYRTDRSGAVFLKIRGGKGTITTWLKSPNDCEKRTPAR